MRRRGWVRVFFVVTTVSLLGLGTPPASADPLADNKAEAARLVEKEHELQRTAERLSEQLAGAQDKLAGLNKELVVSQTQLGKQDAVLASLGSQMTQFAVKSYVYGSTSRGLGTLLSNDGLGNDVAQRDGYSSVLLGGTNDIADQMRAAREDTGKLRVALSSKQKEAAGLVAQTEKQRRDLDAAQAQIDALQTKNTGEFAALVVEARQAAERKRVADAETIRKISDQQRAIAARAPNTAGPTTSASTSRVTTANPTTTVKGQPAPAVTTTIKARPAPPPAPAVSGAAGRAVAAAYSQIGVPYRFATASPGVSFDCSGLTSWAWAQAGVGIPRTSSQQYHALPKVPLDQAQPGDLIFFYGDLHHVGISIGGGQMIHAPYSGSTVSITGISSSVVGAGRPG